MMYQQNSPFSHLSQSFQFSKSKKDPYNANPRRRNLLVNRSVIDQNPNLKKSATPIANRSVDNEPKRLSRKKNLRILSNSQVDVHASLEGRQAQSVTNRPKTTKNGNMFEFRKNSTPTHMPGEKTKHAINYGVNHGISRTEY